MYTQPNALKLLVGVTGVFLMVASYTNLKENPATADENPKIAKLKLQPGFKAEHLYSPSENEQGSWVSMAFDDKGRMITSDQYGILYRLTIPAIGQGTKPKVEKLTVQGDTVALGNAQGLLYAFNSLYVMMNNSSNKKFPRKSGLYRLQDTNGDDQFDKVTLLKELKGDGEHGPHSVILSFDKKSLYIVAGNYTDPPKFDSYRLSPNWKYDKLFPHIKDPRGHATDRKEPGGWIANVDPDGKHWELVSGGYRNTYDIAFNEVGDLFAYDSDMEWDFGLPWYRPTRICHVTSASEYGWRTGSGTWEPVLPDNLPPVIGIGQGSPTNLLHTRDAKFPAKYKNVLLAFDWSFGIVHAIHLKPSGSSYTAERDEFLSGLPLPLTDGVIGPDGALYFLTGGRRLESDLYRVYYNGNEAVETSLASVPTKENTLRREIETFHTDPNPLAIDKAWPNLSHPDRFIRYASRLALEHQPIAEWQQKALAEKDPVKVINAMIGLARQGQPELKESILKSLLSVNYAALSESQKIDILRAFELVIVRMGEPEPATKTRMIAYMNPQFPSTGNEQNKLLSRILVHLEAPGAVAKCVALLDKKEAAGTIAGGQTATSSADLIMRNPQYGLDIAKMLEKTPPVQQTYIATVLTSAKTGWTPPLREKYFKWLRNALNYKGGVSYIGFIDRMRKLALENVPKQQVAYYEKLSGADMLSKSGNDLVIQNYPKGPGKNWKLENAVEVVDKDAGARNFQQGKDMYNAITCSRCHSIQGEGGNVGPDLTQLGTRFSTKDILEAIIDPSKAVSDQYAATQLILKNGDSVVGRLANEDKTFYYISQNPYAPDVLMKVAKKDVVSSKYSSVSVMLPGLINSLNEDELKDLIAYLKSGGNENHEVYTRKSRK
ncbi:c-type cytochrome [Emticicia fluvialis]|uniref:c-type cytochrome n=1 Tax=Emticicia fluvialis TaxID=2974474 RepID=UPI0021665D44|nr:c-type cytochrome [Emticicia fluvialis]